MSRRRHKRATIDKTLQQAVIEKLSHEGSGIARIEGKTTFIQGALPGETVMFIPTENKKDYAKGIATEILTSSEDRVPPPCPHYDVCGGCSLQHFDAEKQIQFKEQVLLENLKHIGEVEPKRILKPMQGDKLAYRHKARLSVRYVEKKESVLVGFRERLSGRFIANIETCSILHTSTGLLIRPFRNLIGTLSNFRKIAQIEVAVGENKTVLILRHLEPFNENDFVLLEDFADKHNICWYLQPGGNDTIHPLIEGDDDDLTYTLPDFNLRYHFRPNDFTQVNPSINRQMIPLALDLLAIETSDRVLDLFCGLGNFSLPIAQSALEVVGVEGCDIMTKRALSNAHLNNIHNVAFYRADLFETIDDASWANSTYNKILLDPPRAGAKEICEQIERFNAERIVYVSCASATLARDSKILISKGYKLIEAGVMDMFPHTAHVESIALFVRK